MSHDTDNDNAPRETNDEDNTLRVLEGSIRIKFCMNGLAEAKVIRTALNIGITDYHSLGGVITEVSLSDESNKLAEETCTSIVKDIETALNGGKQPTEKKTETKPGITLG